MLTYDTASLLQYVAIKIKAHFIERLYCISLDMDLLVHSNQYNNHLEVFKWMYTNGYKIDKEWLCRRYNTSIIKWVYNNIPGIVLNMDHAVYYGDLHLVKWIHKQKNIKCTTSAVDTAATKGHLIVLKWLCENRTELGTVIGLFNTFIRGHEDVVNYLKSIGANEWPN